MKNDLQAPSDTQRHAHKTMLRQFALQGEKSSNDIHRRVAGALADTPEQAHRFLHALEAGFTPDGCVSAFAGVDTAMSFVNCFVQPVGDAVTGRDECGRPGIFTALAEAAETMRLGGAVGYDFSAIRPAGAKVKGAFAEARGPLGFMRIFNQMGDALRGRNGARLAQMAVLRVDHPDIEAFIDAGCGAASFTTGDEVACAEPGEPRSLMNFNLAVAVTDAFMEALMHDRQVELVHEAPPSTECQHRLINGRKFYIHRVVRAREVWDQIMRNNHAGAEMGILFIDRTQRDNSLRYAESIVATGPAGDVPLPPYGACGAGSVDVARFVADPYTPAARFQSDEFRAVVRVAVEMLNQVLDKNRWPLSSQMSEALAKRRIGIGPLGVADAMAMLGMRYGSVEAVGFVDAVMRAMRDEAYAASVELARIHGAFPLFEAEHYLAEGSYAANLPGRVKEQIRAGGIRNSHLICVSPTDAVALAFAGNASCGIEPVRVHEYNVHPDPDDGSASEVKLCSRVQDDLRIRFGVGAAEMGATYATALDLTVDDQLAVLAAASPYVDSAISQTVYVPAGYALDQFEWIYFKAWSYGLKGLAKVRRLAAAKP